MKIGLVTDSASDIPFDWAKEQNIKIVPLNVSFDNEHFIEDENFDFDAYYQNFEERKLFKVNTAQPSPAAFLEKYEQFLEEGFTDIICVTISSGLSGTYNSAVLAGNELEQDGAANVHVVDAKSASLSVVILLEIALEMIEQGKNASEIVRVLEERVPMMKTTLVLPTLKYLKAGGRVSTPKFLIGSLFGLKPITQVDYESGENIAVGTVRNMDKGLEKVYNLTTEEGTDLADRYTITHTNDPTLAHKMEQIIRDNQPNVDIMIVRARSSISAHTGPGALALTALFDHKVR